MKWLRLLWFVPILYAADEKQWTWKDAGQDSRTRAELDAILKAHEGWLETHEDEGSKRLGTTQDPQPVQLSRDLRGADLRGADLRGAHLSMADLRGADLRGAHLSMADLRGVNLSGAHLSDAHLHAAGLSGAHLNGADLNGADLNSAYLSGADLSDAYLNGADLSEADLSGAHLSDAHLSGAHLPDADLSGAYLNGAYLSGADLSGTFFQPSKNPAPESIAYAGHLDRLTWIDNSGPIFALRKSLLEAGFRDAGRQLTASIHRHDQSWLETWLFDRTCAWGANWLRPLGLVGVLSVLCTVIYWAGMHFGKRSGLYLAATGQRITTSKGKERVFRIRVLRPAWTKWYRYIPRFLGRELRALGTAFLFSLMSVFNIGFREFNFGRWIRMLQPREFDIRARGWMRTVSGLQSLLGVLLVALSLLSYFGHPFD